MVKNLKSNGKGDMERMKSMKNKAAVGMGGMVLLLMLNFAGISVMFNKSAYFQFLHQTARQQYEQLNELLLSEGKIEAKKVLAFDHILSVMQEGGKLTPESKERIKALPKDAGKQLEKLVKQWATVKKANKSGIADSLDYPMQKAALIQQSERLVKEIKLLDQQAQASVQKALYIFGFMDIAALLALFFVFRRLYLQKVSKMGEAASSIEDGKLVEIPDLGLKDEVGKLGHALNHMTLHLRNASDFVNKIGEGNLEVDYNYVTALDKDENGLSSALIEMQEKMRKVSREDSQRNWTAEGLANFVDILRSHEGLDELSDAIMSQLTQYMKANQGSLYLVENRGKDNILKLVACYAFDRKKFNDKEVLIGEGLLGQSVIEQHTYYMTEVPENYIRITSGLGEATPDALLIVPLMINGEVMGAIELATFGKFLPHEIQFVEKLGENIASTLKGVKVNEQTKRLLDESQQQAEQLRSQEEEMRQNMEELHATQEEMSRKEKEMIGQLKAIDLSNAMIEFNAEGVILNANQLFFDTMGYSKEEILQQHHRIFVTKEMRGSEEYKEFWQRLAQGEQIKGEFERINKAGKTVWLVGAYTPMLNEEGEVIKVIKLAYDITHQKQLEADNQYQLEQTQAQEEELRQNMEELSTTQEEMEKRMRESERLQVELDARMLALDETALLSESDVYGNITYVNKKFCEVAKYTEDEVMGKAHNILRHPDTPKAVFKELWETIKAGEVFKGSYPNRAKDGSTYWVDATIVPLLDENGKPYKYIGIRMDITDRDDKKIEVKKSLKVKEAK